MMVVVTDASGGSWLVMSRDVPMDDIDVTPIRRLDGVDVLGWKQGQAKHTNRGQPRRPPPQIAVQNHRCIIGARRFRVK